MGRRRAKVAVLGLVAGVLLAGCGDSDSSSSGRFSSVGASISGAGGASLRDGPASDRDAGSASTQDANELPPATVGTASLAVAGGRDLVLTGAMRVEVEDLAAAQAAAIAAIEGLGGFVADEQSTYGDEPRATVTYRVPAESYSAATRAVAGLGDVQEQSRSTEDVSEQVVDLESRLATARASVERLRGFFDAAGDLTQVALLEGELLKRETEVERLTASLRAVEDRVALATVVVTWYEPVDEEEPPAPAEDEEDTALPTFLDGLSVGWIALLRGGQVAGAAAGLALPFAPLLLVGLGTQRLVRRAGARRARTEAPA